ncbi:MAG: O-antigen ligase family protein, partial [Desulfobulbaceae bacterium]|nr:O-antigen ligase family protein [Desulfobulbaceae bacterium]
MLVKRSEFKGEDVTMRGTSLIGPATATGAYLCILWPLGLLAYHRIDSNTKWKRLSLLACFVTPLGALATYSRGAWLGILLIIGLIGFLGYSASRRIIILFAVLVMIIVSHVGLESEFFLVDRIEKRTMAAINDPYGSGYESSRFLSYTDPFKHLLENPSWLLAGTGSAGSKMAERGAIDGSFSGKATIATHSVFGRAYLDYGLPGALCHVFLMLFALALILRNLKYTKHTDQEEHLTWQTLLAVWIGGLLPWWLFGHMAVSTARGSMFLFFIFAIFLTCEQL